MINSYKCPICGKINDLEKEHQVYRCKACTRTVRALSFDTPDLSIMENKVETVEPTPKRRKKKRS